MKDDLLDDVPLWFKIVWSAALALSFALGIVMIWAVIQVVLYLIG